MISGPSSQQAQDLNDQRNQNLATGEKGPERRQGEADRRPSGQVRKGWTTVPSCPSVSTWKNQKGGQGRSAVSGYEAGLRCCR